MRDQGVGCQKLCQQENHWASDPKQGMLSFNMIDFPHPNVALIWKRLLCAFSVLGIDAGRLMAWHGLGKGTSRRMEERLLQKKQKCAYVTCGQF